ncbi:hypothetical protein [Rhodopseudomonas parapalustris]
MSARLPRQIASRTTHTALLLALLTGLAGCVTEGGPGAGPMASAGGTGVAFESIDGPPPQVFDRMVAVLDSESKLRHIPVVSREGGAAYRVRSYLSAQVRGNRTNIAWVWDVYDRNQQRALRLSGEEPAGNGRDAWSQADDVVLRRIAQAGFTGLSGLVNGGLPAEPAKPSAPTASGPAIASAEPTPAASSDASSAALSYAAR